MSGGRCSSFPTVDFFQEHFCDISAMPFPARVRKYNETIVLGQKRKMPSTRIPTGIMAIAGTGWKHGSELQTVYKLPAGERPKRFLKLEPTDAELSRLVAQSPLRFQIEPPADKFNFGPDHL